MVNDRNVEQLLVQANPVLDPEELRLSTSEVDARCASILERRGVMQTQTPTRTPAGTPAPRRWRTPALAFAISLIVVLIAAGGVALLVGGGDPDVIEPTPTTQAPAPTTSTPTPTTTTPTTLPEAVPAGPISTPTYAEVPSFTGTVHFYEHDPALGSAGWEATVGIDHAGAFLYQATMITGGEPYLGPAGSAYLGDGTVVRIVNVDDSYGEIFGEIDNFRSVYFDSEWPSPPWDEICAEGSVSLGSEQLLGRTTTHLACSTSSADYELWVDESAGLVLKMAGPLMIGDYHPTAARDGGFAFTELVFEPVTIFEPPPVETAQTGEYPPFHMIRSATGVVGDQTLEIWYQGADRLRETVIAGEWVGRFTLIADGRLAGCNVYGGDPSCYNVPIEDADDIYPIMMPYHQVPVALVEDSCTEGSREDVAGRPARHFMCDGVDFGNSGTWFVVPAGDSQSEYWFEAETGLMVRELHDGWEAEVTLLELASAFPVGIFTYEELELPDSPSGIQVGDVAPVWRGPLLGGAEFDLADHRRPSGVAGGSYVVVLDWLPWQCQFCVHGLVEFQNLYDAYGKTDTNIQFVMVSETDVDETTHALDRLREQGFGPLDLQVVAAAFDDIDPETGTNQAIYPASPWWLWYEVAEPLPSFTVIDLTGAVVAIHRGDPAEYSAELDRLLAGISGGN